MPGNDRNKGINSKHSCEVVVQLEPLAGDGQTGYTLHTSAFVECYTLHRVLTAKRRRTLEATPAGRWSNVTPPYQLITGVSGIVQPDL